MGRSWLLSVSATRKRRLVWLASRWPRINGGAAIHVNLTHVDGQIRLLVTDEGKGFDVEHAIHNGGLGLGSMRERVRQMNGSIQFISSPGKGTRIEADVPLLHQPAARETQIGGVT